MAMDMSAFGRFTKTFKAGEMIFSEFEPGDNFYLIQSGRVQLQKIIGDLERTLDILQPSEMFGEMAILENSPRSATAIALDDVKVLEFNSQNFEILLMGNPQIALKLLRMFAKRIYDSKRRFMILTLPAHWAGMTTNETRETLGHFVTQRRIEIFPDRISVKNINDFARFVSSRRKKSI